MDDVKKNIQDLSKWITKNKKTFLLLCQKHFGTQSEFVNELIQESKVCVSAFSVETFDSVNLVQHGYQAISPTKIGDKWTIGGDFEITHNSKASVLLGNTWIDVIVKKRGKQFFLVIQPEEVEIELTENLKLLFPYGAWEVTKFV
jgi:hypothetical protein